MEIRGAKKEDKRQCRDGCLVVVAMKGQVGAGGQQRSWEMKLERDHDPLSMCPPSNPPALASETLVTATKKFAHSDHPHIYS